MRCLGEIDGRKRTETFVAYLLTENIATQIECVDEARDRWEIWIREEDQLPAARTKLDEFRSDPLDPRYSAAIQKANQILAEKEKARLQAAKNLRKLESTSRAGNRGPLPPLTMTLFALSVAVSLISSFGSPKKTNDWGQAIMRQLSFVSLEDYQASNEDPAASIKRGEVWRVITPIFLHGDIFHLAMNMFMLISFGRLVERLLGTPRYALFVLLLAIGPNLLQGLSPPGIQGSPFFGGMSGVLYGFFGYIWIRSSLNPTFGINIPFPFIVILIGLLVLGLAGAFPNWHLAHLCHLGGLLIGAALGFASEQK